MANRAMSAYQVDLPMGLSRAYDALTRQNNIKGSFLGSAQAINADGSFSGNDSGLLGWLNQAYRAGQKGVADSIKEQAIAPLTQSPTLLTDYMQTKGTAQDYLKEHISPTDNIFFLNAKDRKELNNELDSAKKSAVDSFTTKLLNTAPQVLRENPEYKTNLETLQQQILDKTKYFDQKDRDSIYTGYLNTMARQAGSDVYTKLVDEANARGIGVGTLLTDPLVMQEAFKQANYNPDYLQNIEFKKALYNTFTDLSKVVNPVQDSITSMQNSGIQTQYMNVARNLAQQILSGNITLEEANAQLNAWTLNTPGANSVFGSNPNLASNIFTNAKQSEFASYLRNSGILSSLGGINAYQVLLKNPNYFKDFITKTAQIQEIASRLGIDANSLSGVKTTLDAVQNYKNNIDLIKSITNMENPVVAGLKTLYDSGIANMFGNSEHDLSTAFSMMNYPVGNDFYKVLPHAQASFGNASGLAPKDNYLVNGLLLQHLATQIPKEIQEDFYNIDSPEEFNEFFNSGKGKELLNNIRKTKVELIKAIQSGKNTVSNSQ